MPEKRTIERARRDKREGKAPSTQAGEFVREEIEHIREGKHGARSAKQAIAIGLSKARRAGVDLPPPKEGVSAETRRKTCGGKQDGVVAPSEKSGFQAYCDRAVRRSQEGGADQGCGRPLDGGTQGGADAGRALASRLTGSAVHFSW